MTARVTDEFDRDAGEAVRLAARDLGVAENGLLAELAQGEIALLVHYLRDAAPRVTDLELRTRIELLLYRLGGWEAE